MNSSAPQSSEAVASSSSVVPVLKVTTVRNHSAASSRSDFRRASGSFRVYVGNNEASDLADAWFDKNDVRSLKFKCRAWGRVSGACSSANLKAMLPVLAATYELPVDGISLKYSRTAGCACGCSPGFVGKLSDACRSSANFYKVSRSDIWMDVVPDADSITLLKAECIRQDAKVQQEIATYNSAEALKVAAASVPEAPEARVAQVLSIDC